MKWFLNNKKILGVALFVLLLLFIPLSTYAQTTWVGKGIADSLTWIIRAIGFIFSFIAGVFLTLAGSLVDLMLDVNLHNLSEGNKLISLGWGIARDLANLGFVLAIIIAAFATIVQYKQYGVKKILPKLIAAAILVNFSMVILMPIIDFSNVLTTFFISGTGVSSNYPSNIKLSQHMAAAFGPQKLIMGETGGEGGDAPPPVSAEEAGGMTGGIGTAVMVSIASVTFNVVFTWLTVFVFFAFAFMLMVRYVTLALLLILAPLAWLFWVIPDLEGMFKNWWHSFFKWVFFAPAVSFFIYIALESAKGLANASAATAATGGNFISGALKNIMVQGSQMILLSGLMIGGLIAAQKMGVYGANGAIGIAKRAGKWGTKKLDRGARRLGSYPFRAKREGGTSVAEKARTWASRQKNFVGRQFGSLLARGLTNAESMGGEKVAKEVEGDIGKESTNQTLAALPGSMGPVKIARINKLIKDEKLNKTNVTSIVNKRTKRLFEQYGQGEKFKGVQKAAGMNVKMNEKFQTYLKAKGTKDEEGALGEFSGATNKFVGSLKKKDLATTPLGDIYSGESKLGIEEADLKKFSNIFSKGIAETNHALTPNIIPRLNSTQRNNFEVNYKEAIKNLEKTDPEKAEKVRKAFENTLANYASGQEAVTAPSGGEKGDEKSGEKPTTK